MTLIIGGAYQGKLSYAISARSDIEPCEQGLDAVWFCEDDKIKAAELEKLGFFEKKIWSGFHLLILGQIKAGVDPVVYWRGHLPILQDKTILCDDISCGIVPIDSLGREWREAVGRTLSMLAGESERVVRLFCGIPTILK